MERTNLDMKTKRLIIREYVAVGMISVIIMIVGVLLWRASVRYFNAQTEAEANRTEYNELFAKRNELKQKQTDAFDEDHIVSKIRSDLGRVYPGEIPYVTAEHPAVREAKADAHNRLTPVQPSSGGVPENATQVGNQGGNQAEQPGNANGNGVGNQQTTTAGGSAQGTGVPANQALGNGTNTVNQGNAQQVATPVNPDNTSAQQDQSAIQDAVVPIPRTKEPDGWLDYFRSFFR